MRIRELKYQTEVNARGLSATIPIDDIVDVKLSNIDVDMISVVGSVREWEKADLAVLTAALAKLSASTKLSFRIQPETPAQDESQRENALERVAALQGLIGNQSTAEMLIEPHDTLYGKTTTAIQRASFLRNATILLSKKQGRVRWIFPLCRDLVYRLETFALEAESFGAELQFSMVNTERFTENDRLFLADFIQYRILDGACIAFPAEDRRFHEKLLTALKENSLASFVEMAGKARGDSLGQGSNAGSNAASALKEVAAVLADGARAHLHRFRIGVAQREPGAGQKPIKTAMLIGAYGGEHIGDAAILGGVLFRLHNRHGLKEAVLFSQRPDHTRHLLEMIKTPVKVVVKEYTFHEIKNTVDKVEAVIFAGGPFIDLPKQLVRHLYSATLAKLRKLPFIMEGIGPGPFPRFASKFTAQRIISLADFVTLRTKESADAEIVDGVEFSVGRDPAFDYLETRGSVQLEFQEGETSDIAQLLAGSEGRPVVGINLRPIYHHYTVGVKNADKARYTAMIEDRFEQRLAEGLSSFHSKSKIKPVYILFPMNAVQFGLSDLTSAWRLGQHLDSDIDYRVWEADASLDAVVALLRRCDAAVTMRFHATIFALSQGVEAIGIDYRIGKRDKVAAVLSDAGKGDQCARIDEMTAEWLESQLSYALSQERFGGKKGLAVNN